jgi:formate-nitrite transporter family protein
MLVGANSVASRIFMAYFVGVLLALGPFDHVTVTTVQLFFGILFGAPIDFGDLATITGIVRVGNLCSLR